MANYRCAQVTMTWAGRRGDVMTKWIVVSLLVGFCGVSGCNSEPEEPVIDSTPELATRIRVHRGSSVGAAAKSALTVQ